MDERIAKQFTISKASPVPLYFQLKTQLVELLKEISESNHSIA